MKLIDFKTGTFNSDELVFGYDWGETPNDIISIIHIKGVVYYEDESSSPIEGVYRHVAHRYDRIHNFKYVVTLTTSDDDPIWYYTVKLYDLDEPKPLFINLPFDETTNLYTTPFGEMTKTELMSLMK